MITVLSRPKPRFEPHKDLARMNCEVFPTCAVLITGRKWSPKDKQWKYRGIALEIKETTRAGDPPTIEREIVQRVMRREYFLESEFK